MGDSGALALGNALVAVTAELHLLWLLPLLGVVFVGETMSVIIQIFSIKRFGRRIFKSSPVHHHFELMGWGEKKIVRRFSEVGAIGAIVTVVVAHYSGLHA
jgi:phospho-N-acetylmuramoyl-pentapeptide-transferase